MSLLRHEFPTSRRRLAEDVIGFGRGSIAKNKFDRACAVGLEDGLRVCELPLHEIQRLVELGRGVAKYHMLPESKEARPRISNLPRHGAQV